LLFGRQQQARNVWVAVVVMVVVVVGKLAMMSDPSMKQKP
jgi:hypothetical protein